MHHKKLVDELKGRADELHNKIIALEAGLGNIVMAPSRDELQARIERLAGECASVQSEAAQVGNDIASIESEIVALGTQGAPAREKRERIRDQLAQIDAIERRVAARRADMKEKWEAERALILVECAALQGRQEIAEVTIRAKRAEALVLAQHRELVDAVVERWGNRALPELAAPKSVTEAVMLCAAVPRDDLDSLLAKAAKLRAEIEELRDKNEILMDSLQTGAATRRDEAMAARARAIREADMLLNPDLYG